MKTLLEMKTLASVPLFVYMLEGTLSIEMEGLGTHTFSAGQGFAEVTNI